MKKLILSDVRRKRKKESESKRKIVSVCLKSLSKKDQRRKIN